MIIYVPQSYAAVKAVYNQLTQEEIDNIIGGVSTPPGATSRDPYAQPVPTLFNLVDRWYYLPDRMHGDRMLAGRLETYYTGAGSNRKQKYRVVTEDGRRLGVAKGFRFLDPQTRQLFTAGDRYETGGGSRDFNMQATTISEGDWDRFFPPGTEGGAPGETARDYMGELQAQNASQESIAAQQLAAEQLIAEQNRAHEMELERLRDARERELARLQEENAMKRTRLGEAGSLARTAAEVQQRTREWIARNQGVDPFRGAVGEAGGVSRGVTPAQAHMAQNQAFVSQPIPVPTESSTLPEIEQTIGALQGQQQAPVAPWLGFEQGGQMQTRQNQAGTFAASPGTTKQAILTGERNFDGDEEVVITDTANPGNVEVIPLVSAAASGGTFDVSTIQQSLSPIYSRMGYSDIPSYNRDSTGAGAIHPGMQGGGRSPLNFAAGLGYRPRLIRTMTGGMDPNNPNLSGHTFFINAQGQRQFVPMGHDPAALRAMGLSPEDVMLVSPDDVRSFYGETGADLTGSPPLVEGGGRMPRSTPLVTPAASGSVMLPDLPQLSGIWRFLGPQTQHVLASAYGISGLGGGPGEPASNALAQIIAAVKAYTPQGSATRAGAGALG